MSEWTVLDEKTAVRAVETLRDEGAVSLEETRGQRVASRVRQEVSGVRIFYAAGDAWFFIPGTEGARHMRWNVHEQILEVKADLRDLELLRDHLQGGGNHAG